MSGSGGERGNHRDIRKGAVDCGAAKERREVADLAARVLTAQMAASLDPTSREYKRARRHHYKTTKNRTEGLDTDWTPFRVAEKKYKARFPPPDLSDVLDLALLDVTRSAEVERAGWKGSADAVLTREIGLRDAQATTTRARKAFTVAGIPGE
jgi:alkylated DNA repair protein alkB homolog 1